MTTDFRAREGSPLLPEEWRALDLAAQDTARARLCGRRFLSLYGPVGPGVEFVESDRYAPPIGATISLLGEEEAGAPLTALRRGALPLPLVYRDVRLHWRDLERARQHGTGLDASVVAAGAGEVAAAEDQLIFHGDARLGIEGLLTAAGVGTVGLVPWDKTGTGYAQIVQGVEALLKAGHPGPYALALSPTRYAQLERVADGTGILELTAVERLVRGPALPCAAVTGAVLVDASAANMDLAVGIDLSVAYADSERMNHVLRVMETVAPRIRRPSAILRFE